MGGKLDQIKGRIKEAAGVLADDDSLKREGQLDQAVGKVKEKAERQQTPRPGQVMKMGRQRKGRGDRIAQPAILVLLPCLSDLRETVTVLVK